VTEHIPVLLAEVLEDRAQVIGSGTRGQVVGDGGDVPHVGIGGGLGAGLAHQFGDLLGAQFASHALDLDHAPATAAGPTEARRVLVGCLELIGIAEGGPRVVIHERPPAHRIAVVGRRLQRR